VVKDKQKQSGMSLTEILVVMAIMAILMGVSIPAAKQLMGSFESSTGTRQLINAALSNARAIAVREQAYAGVRFQEDSNGNTYIIFIQHDKDATGLAYGFRAVTGRKPMKLPEDIGILANGFLPSNSDAQNDTLIDTALGFVDLSTFSIVFSPQGKLTNHLVRIRNFDALVDGSPDGVIDSTIDTIFSTVDNVEAERAMFYQDDYPNPDIAGSTNLGLQEENSAQSFYVYSKSELNTIPANFRWTNYIKALNSEYISPYTGELVMEYREQTP
jgi:prepilin-type N-terminal cleavage/methylation domain-containing protein